MPHERRLTARKIPEYLAYLSLPSHNGGVVVDVSEGGLGFRAIAPVQADGPIHFRFAIDSATRIRAVGELAWVDETGKVGGLRFTELPDEIREQIRIWAAESSFRPRANPKPSVPDLPGAELATEARAGIGSNRKIDPAPVAGTGRPLLYSLKPPIYSAPFYDLSMFSPGLKSGAVANGPAAPQMAPSPEEFREMMRDWPVQASPKGNGRVGPRLKINVGIRSKAGTHHDLPAVEPGIIAVAAHREGSEDTSAVATGLPTLDTAKPPLHRAPSFGLSMFPPGPDLEQKASNGATSTTVAMRHPIAAIGVTIALAFVVSLGIFSYVTTSRAGDWLFDWGQKMWSGSYSQAAPADPAPPAGPSLNSSEIRPQ